MYIRIGDGDWNAITKTGEPVDIVVGIPEELQADGGAKCGLCHICPTFLGVCYFIWLAIIIAAIIIIILLVRRKKDDGEGDGKEKTAS
ncbi:MAG: hypothetical protein NC302_01930 [Bacteroidales bacterium]|nr:hypothetical protein [Bacteroidales bacterium]MCM1417042.1 hypothetical protein [bacterium]MCM1422423.1 hypothetical protein [bacterium]